MYLVNRELYYSGLEADVAETRERALLHEKLGGSCYERGKLNESLSLNLQALMERNNLIERGKDLISKLEQYKRQLPPSAGRFAERGLLERKIIFLKEQLRNDLSMLSSSHARIGWLHYEQEELDAALENYSAAIAVRAKLGLAANEYTSLFTIKNLITEEKMRKKRREQVFVQQTTLAQQAAHLLLERSESEAALTNPSLSNVTIPLANIARIDPFSGYRRPATSEYRTPSIESVDNKVDHLYALKVLPKQCRRPDEKARLQRVRRPNKPTRPRKKVAKAAKTQVQRLGIDLKVTEDGSKRPRKGGAHRTKQQDKEYSKALQIGDWNDSPQARKTFTPAIEMNPDNNVKESQHVGGRNSNGKVKGKKNRKVESPAPMPIQDHIWSFSMLTSKRTRSELKIAEEPPTSLPYC